MPEGDAASRMLVFEKHLLLSQRQLREDHILPSPRSSRSAPSFSAHAMFDSIFSARSHLIGPPDYIFSREPPDWKYEPGVQPNFKDQRGPWR